MPICYLYQINMAFKTTKIALSHTAQFSKLMTDYVKGENYLRPFYGYSPAVEAFDQIIKDKSRDTLNRTLLVDVLKKQYSQSNIKDKDAGIEILLDSKTFTVCTGHQLCLFTGPLYFIYKIITTINLAEILKEKYPTYNFLPVYWMASEDHDFDEIKSVHLFGKTITWNNEQAKGAVGNLNTETLAGVIAELEQVLGDSENANELMQIFRKAYLKHNNLADATRYLVNQLFVDTDLIIVDGNDAALKAEFIPILKDDILNNTNYKLVNKTIEELEGLGFKAQVNPREINCFYMTDGARERVIVHDDATKEKLIKELEQNPEHFSPNVVTRPLYQQAILPNLAYVGGPGEIAYWLEYKAMFDAHKLIFPILIPRNFAMLTDEKINQQLHKLGIEIKDVFKDTEALIKEFVSKHAGAELSLKQEELKLIKTFDEIAEKAISLDITLKSNVDAEKQKAINALKNIEAKLLRSEKQKQDTAVQQIKKVKEKLFPQGVLQERHENFAPYYLKYGKQFIAKLKQQFNPFEIEMMIVEV